MVRVICNLTLYGFPVIMPLYLATTNNGGGAWFKVSQWSQIWGFQFMVTIFGNVFWGRMGDSHGWMRQMRWFGCWFCVIGTLGMYYIPQFSGRIWYLCVLMRLFLDWEFPLSFLWEPCFPRWRWNIKVAAISAHNFASGLATFFGPLIATVLVSTIGFGGVCWTYAICYAIGSVGHVRHSSSSTRIDDRGHRIAAIER